MGRTDRVRRRADPREDAAPRRLSLPDLKLPPPTIGYLNAASRHERAGHPHGQALDRTFLSSLIKLAGSWRAQQRALADDEPLSCSGWNEEIPGLNRMSNKLNGL